MSKRGKKDAAKKGYPSVPPKSYKFREPDELKRGKKEKTCLIFSFKHLVHQDEDGVFDFSCCDDGYFKSMVERLKTYSQMTLVETLQQEETLHCHKIKDFENTSKRNGFDFLRLSEEINTSAYSMGVSSKSRFHGFYIDPIFFVVWLDPKHLLYEQD